MSEDWPDFETLRALAARLREAREAQGWTQQQLADRSGIALATVVAIEKGQGGLKPQDLIGLAFTLSRSVSELLQRNAINDEPCSSRSAALAIKAWQHGEISEGQLARFLRTDRVGARERVREMELAKTGGENLWES